MISIHDLTEVELLRRRQRVDGHQLRQLRKRFYKQQASPAAALNELPEPERAAFASAIEFHALELHSRHDSQLDGATKLIFRTGGQLLLESVILRIATGRTALCLSTQVGCAANCDFCATGKMGIARNLTPAEILDQVIHAQRLLAPEGRSVRNLVFMGMGEPFHNEDALHAALEVLFEPGCFNLSPKRVLISTVGIPAAMRRCAQRWPEVRLALSLHSAREEVRRRIMLISQRHSLGKLREALLEVAAAGRQPVMIEYLLLDQVNDSDADAEALIDYLDGIPVHINLIPYNPIAEAPHLIASGPERRGQFSDRLKAAGLRVTTRYSLGADIAAACGQLVRQEHRRRETDRIAR